jgi:hypothetical protein
MLTLAHSRSRCSGETPDNVVLTQVGFWWVLPEWTARVWEVVIVGPNASC